MRLNCIMKRSSSLRASRGFLSLSYCRRSFISASVGKKRIKHSTKSTRVVRRSKLQKHKATYAVTQKTGNPSCTASLSAVMSVSYYCNNCSVTAFFITVIITLVTFRVTVIILQFIFSLVSVISTRRRFFRPVKMYWLSWQWCACTDWVSFRLDLNIRVDCPTDDVRSLASLPQGDRQVFGSVGFKQGDFGWTLLRKFLSG